MATRSPATVTHSARRFVLAGAAFLLVALGALPVGTPRRAVVASVFAAGLGLTMAVAGVDPALGVAHYRLNLLGSLGLSIVGPGYRFYPPTVGDWPGTTDRAAVASLICPAGGLAVDAAGLIAGVALLADAGVALALVGRWAVPTSRRRRSARIRRDCLGPIRSITYMLSWRKQNSLYAHAVPGIMSLPLTYNLCLTT
jgi:hypothetical protein